MCNDYKGTQLVCTALEELNTEDEMPDDIEISEEEFLSYPDSDSELNFVCLEDYESGSSESDQRGKYNTESSSDEIYHSDINKPYGQYTSSSYEPYKSPHKSLSPSYNPYCSSMEEFS